jgi:lycopene cyclase domain-containing protein
MTYLLLNGAFLAVVLVLVVLLLRGARTGGRALERWWPRTAVVFLALAVLTVVFDSIMIWADLFRFEDEHMSGLRIGLAPIEDLAWPLASALLLPALWTWLGRRDAAPTSARSGSTAATAKEGTS